MRHLPLLALALLAAPPIQAQTPAPAPPQCEAAVTQVVTNTDSVHVTTLTSCPVVVVRDTFVRVDTVAPTDTVTPPPPPPPDTVTPAPEPEPEPAPSPSGFPHLPSTYTRFSEHTFQALPSTSGSAGQLAGRWYSSPSNPRLTIQSDSRAPKTPSNVFQFRFYDGMTVGGSLGLINTWATYENGSPPEYREFYESAWFRIPTPDFETPGPGMKLLGFWGVGQKGTRAPGQVYMQIGGNGTSTSKMSSWSFDFRQQNQVSRSMPANRSSKRIRAGMWHRYEVQMVLNTIGQANGVLRFWLDNGDGSGLTLTHEYTNVVFRTSTSPTGFYGRQWDPVWGGMDSSPNSAKTRHDYLQVDHLFLAGRRM